jgi:hypothetical protein
MVQRIFLNINGKITKGFIVDEDIEVLPVPNNSEHLYVEEKPANYKENFNYHVESDGKKYIRKDLSVKDTTKKTDTEYPDTKSRYTGPQIIEVGGGGEIHQKKTAQGKKKIIQKKTLNIIII